MSSEETKTTKVMKWVLGGVLAVVIGLGVMAAVFTTDAGNINPQSTPAASTQSW